MYMRMQLAFRDDYEATLKASLKTVSSAKHKDELSAKAHVAQLTLERDALLVHNQTLSKQMDETEAMKALVTVQSMQALEQSRAATEHVLHQLADVRVELKTALDTGRWQAAQLDDKEQANGLLTQKIESLMRNTHGGGGDQQSKGRVEGGGAAVGGNMKGVSSLDADMRQANLKISHLEAENHANRDQIKDLKAKLQGYLGSAHAVAFTQAQKDATRFKERVKDVEGKLAAAEAVVMKTRGQLAEKGTRLQALQAEYDKIFTALQRESDKKQAATSTPESVSADEASRLANDNQYVTGFYRTKLEHQAAEILGLRKQIKKMLTLQHQTYFDHSLHKKEHLRLLTRYAELKRLDDKNSTSPIIASPTNNQSMRHRHAVSTPSLHSGDGEARKVDRKQLVRRNQFLERFFREHCGDGDALDNHPMARSPPQSKLKHRATTTSTTSTPIIPTPPSTALQSVVTTTTIPVPMTGTPPFTPPPRLNTPTTKPKPSKRPASAAVAKPKQVGDPRQSFVVGALVAKDI
ncbi:hypothetical protein, variant [Aphanomyces astaci]|nr:hypothetical protein, variant [Aphanomyces astaci]ETV84969.1 hypothetical protein, variant [Aphanomyces astaci]|eukprot:XP_009824987.1 hypothetical protein, variant [Aphanomyces astaci]